MFREDFIAMRGTNRPIPAAWSRSEDKLFEQALVLFPDETPDRWARIAAAVPGKSAWEVREHYEALLHDVSEIDSGRIEVPRYTGESSWVEDGTGPGQSQISFGSSGGRGKATEGNAERKKGVPWTEEEHRLFLIGLQKYGRGDWRSISRNAVVSRTPTQVASHAQKYYLRLNSVKKEKKRASIHDITSVNGAPTPQQSENWGGPSAAASPQPDGIGQTQTMERTFGGQSSGQGSYGYPRFGYPM